MIKIIPIMMFFSFLSLKVYANIVDDIGKKLEMIKYEDTKKVQEITHISYDPFHTNEEAKVTIIKKDGTKKVVTKSKIVKKMPNLSMIFNKKAFIDGKWYKENMKVADYVLKRINENSVILKKKNKITTLRLNSKKNIFFKRGTDK